MLNKDGQRELAYVVKIDNIEPIIGSDNCEAAIVGGWRVMVRKETFKPGDLAIYFEIDSKVPEIEEFAFLAKKHYKVKTQKYTFGGKGCMISQGLLMHPKDFGWRTDFIGLDPVIINDEEQQAYRLDDESRFLTNKLGVVYSVQEDNVRKSASSDKYKSMAGRHLKVFSTKLVRWMMGYNWGKKLLFVFFGRGTKSSEWPAWVVKTDEERCLPGATKILTSKGWIQINKIVNQKLDVTVASVNNDGVIEYKPIVDYQKFKNTTPMVTIKYPYKPTTTRTNALCCTFDHRVFTTRGYVEAKDITVNDNVLMPVKSFTEDCLSPIYGMLLGDSHIYNDKRANGMLRIVATNGEKQLEYLKYKQSIFNSGNISKFKSGFSTTSVYHWFMNVDPFVSEQVKKDWYINNKKIITDGVINKITPISLAFWYMDDGCLSYRNTANTSYFIRLNTQGFSYNENIKLSNMLLDKFNVKSKVNIDKTSKNGSQLYRIDISSTEEADKFLSLIAPYIHDSMLYKLPTKFKGREFNTLAYTQKEWVMPIQVVSVEQGQTKNKMWGNHFDVVYDIEVADNHNFIADNIVVHNCQNMPWILKDKSPWIATEKIDGTSTTFTVHKKKHGNKYDFYVCSRNVVFDKPDKRSNIATDKQCFYDTNVYLEMAEKYNIEKVLTEIATKYNYEWVTLQGETYGERIQKRDYSLKEHRFAGFNFITPDKGRWNSVEAANFLNIYNIPWVPIVSTEYILPDTIDELLMAATNTSAIDGKEREGLVFRSQDGQKSFKAVSNEFLLKYHG